MFTSLLQGISIYIKFPYWEKKRKNLYVVYSILGGSIIKPNCTVSLRWMLAVVQEDLSSFEIDWFIDCWLTECSLWGGGKGPVRFARVKNTVFRLRTVVEPCLFSSELRFLGANQQSHTHTHWSAGMGGLAGSAVRQSGWPFMRLHESAGTNDKRLIIWDQADLLHNPTPQSSPGRPLATPARGKDESETGMLLTLPPPPRLFHPRAVYL